MGSFSEVVLGFSFKPDAPDYVLAAFSSLAATTPSGLLAGTPPDLPVPHDLNWERDDWEPTDEEADPSTDAAPWRHDWARWFSHSASVSITPSAQLVWSETRTWTLSCRWGIKSHPASIVPALRWLGRYLIAFDQRPILLGYITYTGEPRPTLVWLTPDGDVQGEDLS